MESPPRSYPFHHYHHLLKTLLAFCLPLLALTKFAMQSLYGNTTASTSRSSLRARDAHNSRRHDPIGPSRTRLVTRHNPYATTPSQQDTEGSTAKGQRRNRREGRPKSSTERVGVCSDLHLRRRSLTSSRQPSANSADVSAATPSGTWAGASQDATYLRLPESTSTLRSPGHTTPQPESSPAVSV